MKTYINGQKKIIDTEMATKYQLGKVYTKVQNHINSINSDLISLSSQVLEKEQALINKDNQLTTNINNFIEYTGNNIIILNNINPILDPINNIVYRYVLTDNDNITINKSNLSLTKQIIFELHLIQPVTAVNFTLPNDLIWYKNDKYDPNNPIPSMNEDNTLYCIIIKWDGISLLAKLDYSKILI